MTDSQVQKLKEEVASLRKQLKEANMTIWQQEREMKKKDGEIKVVEKLLDEQLEQPRVVYELFLPKEDIMNIAKNNAQHLQLSENADSLSFGDNSVAVN